MPYQILQALESIKTEIERYEKEMKSKSGYYKKALEDQCRWTFSKGVDIILLAKPGDISPKIKDWYLGRADRKPFNLEKEILKKLRKTKFRRWLSEIWDEVWFRR